MKNKREKAITLIALVITIIILIILAGITINLLLGKNGLIERTREGKIKTEVSREKEILQMSLSAIQAENEGNLLFDEITLLDKIKNYEKNVEVTKSGKNMYLVKYNDSNREYEVYSNGEIDKATEKVIDKNPGEFEGEGTETNPYLIQSIEDLVALSNKVNAGENYEDKYFKIENDLNFISKNSYVNPDRTDYGDINEDNTTQTLMEELTTGKGFKPIGCIIDRNTTNLFSGNIDGNNKTIKNLYIGNRNYAGLIGVASNVKISRLSIDNMSNIGTLSYRSGILAYLESGTCTIENCKVTGKNSIEQASDCGGIIGNIGNAESVLIRDCTSKLNINSVNSGGIVGSISSCQSIKIENCINLGDLNYMYNAGIVGGISYGNEIEIVDCTNYGNMEGRGYMAGIMSYTKFKNTTIKNCCNVGTIKNKDNIIQEGWAGILGIAMGNEKVLVEKCYNIGNIKGGYNVAGIIGKGNDESKTIINNCYNNGTIEGQQYVIGGILGSTGTVTNSYNRGKIIANAQQPRRIGGIAGGYANIENCYNIGSINSVVPKNGSAQYIGGIIGNTNKNTIKNSYNFGNITLEEVTTTNYNKGGIVGYEENDSTFENEYYLEKTADIGIGNKEKDETGKIESINTEESLLNLMKNKLLSQEEWKEDEDSGYPILSWQ